MLLQNICGVLQKACMDETSDEVIKSNLAGCGPHGGLPVISLNTASSHHLCSLTGTCAISNKPILRNIVLYHFQVESNQQTKQTTVA